MKLFPALKIAGDIIKGEANDSHNTIAISHNLPKPTEQQRGFTPDGKLFLTRKQALGWLKYNDIKTFRKLPSKAHYSGLHSEHLAKAYDIEQKPEATAIRIEAQTKSSTVTDTKETVNSKVDLSEKTALIYDRGLYLYIAEKLAKSFKQVMYFIPSSDAYPCSNLHNIGTGITGVKRIYDFWSNVDKADIIVFPDAYDGTLQQFLRDKGYKVFGCGLGEKPETDKIFFMDKLEELKLPLPKTYLAEGIDDACNYLEREGGPKWLKGMTRGDFETKKYTSMHHFKPFVDDLKRKLGKRVNKMELLIQNPIDAEIEVGYDGFMLNGEYSGNCLVGYEIKDKCYVATVKEQPCDIVKYINDAFAPVYKKLGYQGAYSTEIRVTKDGTPYFIDPTCRFGSPPGELMSEIYDNYAEVIWSLAHEELLTPEPAAKYGAQMILTSDWYRDSHEICFEYPKKYKDNIKLSNYYKEGGRTYIVPNDTEQYFGSVVTIADSIEEALEQLEEICESIVCEKLDYASDVLEEAKEQIEKGKQFGVEF